MKIKSLFKRLHSQSRKAFVAYLTAGDRSFEESLQYLQTLESSGVDIIELGVPHSDPVADGPTIVRASERALASGGGLSQALELVGRMRQNGSTIPIVLFSYLNPILKMGFENFAQNAIDRGVDGILILDLPPEESFHYVHCMKSFGLDTIFLASPTTSDERFALINSLSTGFLYYVSSPGVTGSKSRLPEDLNDRILHLKNLTTLPICVGFGISTPEQALAVATIASGVVVGSALVKCIETSLSREDANTQLESLANLLSSSIQNNTQQRNYSIC